MSAMAKMIERMVSLEKEMASLKVMVSSSKDKKEVPATKDKKEKKAVKDKKESKGPTEWNVFVKATQKEMAAAKGVLMAAGEEGEKVFKAVAAKKDSGFGWQTAMKEASRRKDELEGRDHSVKEAKKEEAKAAKKAKKEESESEEEDSGSGSSGSSESGEGSELEKQIASLDMEIKTIGGIKYIVDAAGGDAYLLENDTFGDRAGAYDGKMGTIDLTA